VFKFDLCLSVPQSWTVSGVAPGHCGVFLGKNILTASSIPVLALEDNTVFSGLSD
jgi:hypothetical protein